MDILFNNTDIAIGTLGIYRKNVALDSSLKHREYCARGVPFVLSSDDPDFSVELPWVHYVAADDSAVSLFDLIQFWKNIKKRAVVKEEIRKFAVERIDWYVKLEGMMEQIGI